MNSPEGQRAIDFLIPDGGRAWLGFHDRHTEAGCEDLGFIWTDGMPTTYTNWANGEPNDWQAGVAHCDGTGNEDCTEAWQGGATWNDAECSGPRPYICGFPDVPYGAPNRYELVAESKSAAAAEDACIMKGGHLASVHSQDDQDIIDALIPDGGRAWLGFHDRHEEGGCDELSFIWTDATPTDYTNWASGEPNDWQAGVANCDGSGNEDCTEA